MEQERPAHFFDVAAISEALECPPQQRGPDVVGFNLKNEPLGISMRLDVIEPRRAISLYLRGGQAFLGFIHIEAVERMTIDHHKGEVTFISDAEATSRLSIQRGGVFLATRRTD